MSEEVTSRLEELERKNRRLELIVGLTIVVLAGGLVTAATWQATASAQDSERVVRAKEFIIEDERGVVRARLGADLPDAVVDGDTIERGTQAAGLTLYDRTGTERGGYVTFDENDNVLLTLDAADESVDYRLTAYFVAEPDGATALRIWSGDDQVEMRAGSDGGARFKAVRGGQLVFQNPELSRSQRKSMCAELKGLLEKFDRSRLMASCRQRMTEEACEACLGRGQP